MNVHLHLESSLRNLRLAIRSLRKTPAFTVTILLTLALGIGANSAVFSAIDAVLLKPLPFPNGDQLVRLSQSNPKNPQPFVAPVRLEEWNHMNSTLQAITGYYAQDESELSGELPEKLRRALVAPRFLQVWGVAPELGRDFNAEEEHFGGPSSALISDRLWRRKFGANPDVVGKSLRLGRSSVAIIGVMPASFLFPERDVDLWSPSPADAPFAQGRELTWFTAIGRLKPGVTLTQVRANMATVQADLGRQFPKTDSQISAIVESLKESTVGGVRRSLWMLFASVSLVLLIACANVIALLLSRTAVRRQEISVRFSLGASRMQIAAQLLAEVFVLAVTGAGLGLLLASGASRVFRALAASLPRIEEVGLDWRIVIYSFTCAIAVTLVCGIFPAVRGTRQDLGGGLALASRSHVSGRNPIQFTVVGIQVALAMTLLVVAGLLLRSFQELGRVTPGFDPKHVLTFHISMSWGETGDKATAQRFDRILDALRSVPGVETAAMAYSLPGVLTDYQNEVKNVGGRPETEPKMIAQSRSVSPDYFATLHIPIVSGEACSTGVPTMMVNRSFANTYFGGAGVIGTHLSLPGNAWVAASEVRGIVGDAREMGLERTPVPTVYWCFGANQPGGYFLVRTRGEPQVMSQTIRRKIHEIEPGRSVYDLVTLESKISDAYAQERLRTILLACFAVTAVSLACVGLYGTVSYMVNIRRREVGLRLALGAMRGQIVRQFLSQGLRISILGCAAGSILAFASGQAISGMLYGVSGTDAAMLGTVGTIVLAVSILASLIPAIRASRLDPMRVLRED